MKRQELKLLLKEILNILKESDDGMSYKERQVKSLLAQLTDETIVVTVQRNKELPEADYVQVDGFVGGQNVFSSNAEDLNKWGLKMPSTKEFLTLPQGRYKLSDAKRQLHKPLDEEMSYDQLLKLTDKTPKSPEDGTSRIDRSKNVRARSIPVSTEENKEQWNFRYKSNPSVTNKPFEGNIMFLKGEVGNKDDAAQLQCKVDCSCPDYRYKFAYNNFKQGAGEIGPNSLNKCINRSPQPAYDIGEGLCKHLVALRGYLQTKIKSTQKSNLFEAINEVAKQGPFNITYYD